MCARDCSPTEGTSDAFVLTMYLTLVEQALKKLSVQELCALMEDMDLVYCARAFQKDELNGEELLELSKEEVVSMVKDYGEISNHHCYCL